MTSRASQLTALARKVRVLETQLANTLHGKEALKKWQWPAEALQIVSQLQDLARKNNALVRGPLDRLLEWPNPASADLKLFLGGKPGFEAFDRAENWFEQMGFDQYSTPYTFSSAWDKRLMKAMILVPKGLQAGTKVPVMWFFHGGGFCTGAGDFIPWYSKASMEHARRKNAIVIAPDYPLGPEANYKDIVDSIREFLQWYGADGCFEPGFKSWREWLITTAKLGHVELLFDRVLMEGESAGGHAAVTALFRNAAKKNTRKLNIDAVLLRYPMLKHYTRKFPDEGSVTYMNKKFSKEQVDAQVNKINAAVDELERVDLVPTRAGDHPPHGMAFAFLLSMSGKWEESFTRRHHRDHDAEMPGDPDYMDCLERAHYYAPNVENARLPPIMMYHGHDDPNCPFSDTHQFLDLLTQKYDSRYTKGETVVLEKVYELNAKPQFDARKGVLVQGPTTAVGHGFDYNLEGEKEPFLKRTHEGIDGFWGKE